MHNTVMVDGRDQHELSKHALFSVADYALPAGNRYETSGHYDIYTGSHDGYLRLPAPVKHKRSLCLNKDAGSVEIIDELQSVGKHDYAWHFHLASSVTPEIRDKTVMLCASEQQYVLLCMESDGAFSIDVIDDTLSPSYGVMVPSKSIRVVRQQAAACIMKTQIRVTKDR